MRKAWSLCFLGGLFLLSFLPLTSLVFSFPSAQARATTVEYYLNAGNLISGTVCASSQNVAVMGSLDLVSPLADSVTLNGNYSIWNTFCTIVPVLIGVPLAIKSVNLTLFVCCGNSNTPYAFFAQLVDNSTSPPTVLANFDNFIDISVAGTTCASSTKIAEEIPLNTTFMPMFVPGDNLLLLFHFGGLPSATLCTGSGITQNTPSSLFITGRPNRTTTSSSTAGNISSTFTNSSQSSSSSIDNSSSHSNASGLSSSTFQSSSVASQNQASIESPLLLAGVVVSVIGVVTVVTALRGRKT